MSFFLLKLNLGNLSLYSLHFLVKPAKEIDKPMKNFCVSWSLEVHDKEGQKYYCVLNRLQFF